MSFSSDWGFAVAKNLGHNSLEDDERGIDVRTNVVGATIGRPFFDEFIGRQNASPTEFDVDFGRGGVSPPAISNFDLSRAIVLIYNGTSWRRPLPSLIYFVCEITAILIAICLLFYN